MGVMNEDRLTLYDGLIKTHITNTTVAKEAGKGLSTNDYTTTEKNKLAGIADGANKTIVDSALDASSENPVQNKVIAGEITTLKKSVSDGKTLVATAITDKGVETAADATFAVMAENIGQIETGGGELHGATISVSTSEENPTTITVTLTKDSTTIGQKNFDSNGTCTFTDIQESGDYTITASNEDISNSTTVTITGDNIVNKTVTSVTIEFTLDGSTATPLNDVSIWLRTDSTGSSLNAGHTTLAEVIADTTTLSSLMADESAMNYLARSTGFADEGCASETFMTYLGASPHVDSTVLNSDLWKQKIKASQYWTLVYASKTVTVYGGAYETITIDGYYGSFTTNADGSVSHVVPIDTITLTGSVSGQSFTRAVTTDTADVYVMPEGALYWYGNECGITYPLNYKYTFYTANIYDGTISVTMQTNSFRTVASNNTIEPSCYANKLGYFKIEKTNYTKVKKLCILQLKNSGDLTRIDATKTISNGDIDSSSGNSPSGFILTSEVSTIKYDDGKVLTVKTLDSTSIDFYLAHHVVGGYKESCDCTIYAIWTE